MCGIAGYFSTNNFFDEEDLSKMTNCLSHRGPDSHGYFKDEQIALGHRRLSILDLSENGNQPMLSHDKRYVMIYNGEVYNYREIANELVYSAGRKLHFNSSSDSEVILEAFATWGENFVKKLNGMFAIAIYDRHDKELFLFRDRIGIKPLYYYWDGKNFAFSSELKALEKVKNIPKKIDNDAIYYYLHTGFIPAPYSIYSGIKKMKPGQMLKISDQGINHETYWSTKDALKEKVIQSEKTAIIKLSDLIISSVLYQMKTDVPFGIFLSGGVDSSLIAAQAVNLSSVKVNTFSIGFEESKYNEASYARAISGYLRTNHHEFIVSYKDGIELMDKMLQAYNEPFADSSAIPTMLVSMLASKYVTVVLTGDGGDELFMGYGAYKWASRLNNPLIKLTRHQLSSLLSLFGNKLKRGAKLFDYESSNELNSHILSQEQYFFSKKELDEMLITPFKSTINNIYDISHWSYPRKLTHKEKQALFDLNYYLPDDLLVKVDRASMQYSVEARVPYLDHRIVEFAENIAPNLKYKNGVSKYILKEILYQYIPEKFFRRPKQGFSIPLEKWLKNEWVYLINDFLSKKVIEKHGFVKYDYVSNLKKDFFKGKDYLYNRLWALAILHKWAEDAEKS